MKTKLLLVIFAISFVVAPFAFAGGPDKADSKYTDEQVAKVQKQVSGHEGRIKGLETSVKKDSDEQNKRIAELEKKVEDLSGKLAELKEWSEEKWNTGKRELEKVNAKAKDGREKSNLALWILVPVVAVVLVVLVFFFWPRKPVSSAVPGASDRPKCPRCGWEHAPGDTVCKNPACKTQF